MIYIEYVSNNDHIQLMSSDLADEHLFLLRLEDILQRFLLLRRERDGWV